MELSSVAVRAAHAALFPFRHRLHDLSVAGVHSRLQPLSLRDGSLLPVDEESTRFLAQAITQISVTPHVEIATELLDDHLEFPPDEREHLLSQLVSWVATFSLVFERESRPWDDALSLVSLPLGSGLRYLPAELLAGYDDSSMLALFLVPGLTSEGLCVREPTTTRARLEDVEDPASWETALVLWDPPAGSTLSTLRGAFETAQALRVSA